MACIRKKGDIYFIDYYVQGKRVRKVVGKSKAKAESALAKAKEEVHKAGQQPASSPTSFRQFFSQYLKETQARVSRSSHKRYTAIIGNFFGYLQKEFPSLSKVSQITLEIIEGYRDFRIKEKVSPRTVKTEMTVLRNVFTSAVDQGLIEKNPTDKLAPLQKPKGKKLRYLTARECRALLAAADQWFYPVLYTLLHTGLKKHELESLRWDDVDLGGKTITVRHTDEVTGKSSQRVIPMTDDLVEVLQDRIFESRASEFVFTEKDGKPLTPNRLRLSLIRLTKKCGIEGVTKLEVLRHTFAARLIKSGADLVTLKKVMGFASMNSVMIYEHLNEGNIDEAIERLEF